jgi:hypothetical protein
MPSVVQFAFPTVHLSAQFTKSDAKSRLHTSKHASSQSKHVAQEEGDAEGEGELVTGVLPHGYS